jgi:predicted O-methyltransferase YrrM
MEDLWRRVDDYFEERLGLSDGALDAALKDSSAAGLPPINVTPAQGKLLSLFATACKARRILEVGTLGGYSTIWMARALPEDGTLITLEIDAGHVAVAQRNLQRAGVARRVTVMLAPATESLARLIHDRVEPFDLVFIDADKERSVTYFEAALALSRSGTLVVVDNVVRKGGILDAASRDGNIVGMRALTERVAQEPRVSATAIQTVGGKGYDGFILAVVR